MAYSSRVITHDGRAQEVNNRQLEQLLRACWAWCEFFEISNPTPSDTLTPKKPHLQILSKQISTKWQTSIQR